MAQGQLQRLDKKRLVPLMLALLWLFCSVPSLSRAEDGAVFNVVSAMTHADDQVLRLNARFDLQFSEALIDALHNGVSLVLLIEIEALRERDYVWSESIARIEQRYQLSYQALTEQYILDNINSGVRFKFPNFEALRQVAGNLVDFPFLDLSLLDDESRYLGQLRIGIDRDQFPTPLMLMSYFSSDWHPQSEWYTWPLR